jgi:ADP-ribose pyrophosphatase YjhB (NUDIX family)
VIKKFHIGVKAVIISAKKALVLKELDVKGSGEIIYNLPGGRMEDNEAIKDTLKRELKEELGIFNYSLGPLVSASKHPYYDKNKIGLVLLFFKVNVKNHKFKLGKEFVGYQWISKKDLNNMIKNKEKIHKGIIETLQIALH